MTALPAFIYPENIWPVALTGKEFVPIYAGSPYPTVVTISTLKAFIGAPGALVGLPTSPSGLIPGTMWNNGGVLCVT